MKLSTGLEENLLNEPLVANHYVEGLKMAEGLQLMYAKKKAKINKIRKAYTITESTLRAWIGKNEIIFENIHNFLDLRFQIIFQLLKAGIDEDIAGIVINRIELLLVELKVKGFIKRLSNEQYSRMRSIISTRPKDPFLEELEMEESDPDDSEEAFQEEVDDMKQSVINLAGADPDFFKRGSAENSKKEDDIDLDISSTLSSELEEMLRNLIEEQEEQ